MKEISVNSSRKVFYLPICGIIPVMLEKLERRIGKYAVKNLIYYVLGGYAVGYILYIMYYLSVNNWYLYITLDPALVMRGQVWRLFTWVLTIPQSFSLWLVFMFLLYYFIGKSLEATIGTFRYNVYIFSGWLFTTLGAMVVYWITLAMPSIDGGISIDASTYYINMASFLAFAVLYPEYRVYLFGIIPLKMKWLAIFDIVYLGIDIMGYFAMFTSYGAQVIELYGYEVSVYRAYAAAEIFCILISLLNFIIFWIMNRSLKAKQARRSNQFKRSYNAGMNANANGAFYSQAQRNTQRSAAGKASYRPQSGNGEIVHRCAICGRTSTEFPNLTFRYCSKCAGNHEYCQDHLFTHEHVK